MNTFLEPTAKPLLGGHVKFTESDNEINVETNDAVYTFSDESGRIIAALKNRLDGSRHLSELASEAGVSTDELGETLAVLADDKVLIDARLIEEATSPEEFIEAYLDLCRLWVKEIFTTPFWQAIYSGQASRTLVLGWGVEFYHYVHAANEHMAAAVAYCREDKVVRQWLAEHYVEEHDHGTIFLEGLAVAGLDREQVVNAPPLASTRTLINFLNELAISDSVAYTGAFGIMHAPESDQPRDAYQKFYDSLISSYGFAAGMFNAFRQHAALDADLGHEELLLKRILVRDGVVGPERIRKILAAARGAVEVFTLYFEGIYEFYSAPNAPLPRRPLDIRMYL